MEGIDKDKQLETAKKLFKLNNDIIGRLIWMSQQFSQK